MPPIAARCGRQPPTGPSRSPPLNTKLRSPTPTTALTPRATRIRTSPPGAGHENGERTIAAVPGREMACAGAFGARSCHRIQPHPPGRPTLCARRDFASGGLARAVLLSSRRRLLVCISADRRYAGFACASAGGLRTASKPATAAACANTLCASLSNAATGCILKTTRQARVLARVATPASPDTRSNPRASARIRTARVPTVFRRARPTPRARRIRPPC